LCTLPYLLLNSWFLLLVSCSMFQWFMRNCWSRCYLWHPESTQSPLRILGEQVWFELHDIQAEQMSINAWKNASWICCNKIDFSFKHSSSKDIFKNHIYFSLLGTILWREICSKVDAFLCLTKHDIAYLLHPEICLFWLAKKWNMVISVISFFWDGAFLCCPGLFQTPGLK
jgi:hypothetical protein